MLGKSEPGIGRAPALAAAGLLAVTALGGLGWSIARSAGPALKPTAATEQPAPTAPAPAPIAAAPQPITAAPPATPAPAADAPQPPRIETPRHALNDPPLGNPAARAAEPPAVEPPPNPDTTTKPAKPSKININTATAAELELLPGIGPSLAQRIIDYRAKTGRFRTVAELDKVKGIGPKTIEKLRPLVTVEP